MPSLRRMRIFSLMYDLTARSPVVVLKEEEGDRYLPILIGYFEATAIEMGLKKKRPTRPLTHDLISNFLHEMHLTVFQIQVAKIEDHTFYANIILSGDGETYEIDARPSDAIAIAIREEAPIVVSEEILNDAGVQASDPPGQSGSFGEELYTSLNTDDPEEFRQFIAGLRPEDLFPVDDSEPGAEG